MENIALENLKTRRSVRSYSSRPVEDEKLNAILEAATYAPTGMGSQSPVIVLVKSPEMVKKISKMNAAVMGREIDPFYGAPAVAIVFGNKELVPTWFEDACLVAGNLLNAAHAIGVDSCFIYRAKETFSSAEGIALLKEWGLNENYVGVANCILGYGEGEEPQPKPRKSDYIKII
ncbi:MAG: nitroreductase family protein [Oscillospiraceae bacterium]|nr:nitroreductase family protein [Oscillospiraceae bacterium]